MKPPLKALCLSLIRIGVSVFSVYAVICFLCGKYVNLSAGYIALPCGVTVLIFIFRGAYIKSFSVTVRGNKLIIKKGIFVKHETVLYLKRIMSVKEFSSPLMRLLELEDILLICQGSVYFLWLLKKNHAKDILSTLEKVRNLNEKL